MRSPALRAVRVLAAPVTGLALLIGGTPQARLAARAPEGAFTTEANVEYCTGSGHPLRMDVFVPQARVASPTPAFLWIHGGGWEHGDKSASAVPKLLAATGFVAASVNYRLSGEAVFPAAIEDTKCAIRYLRANAALYGIDPDRIGAAGDSAGGHLAMLAAVAGPMAVMEGTGGWPGVSSRLQAVASYCGVSDLTVPFPAATVPFLVEFVGPPVADEVPKYAKASPVGYVAKGDPPLLLVHGRDDVDVPFDQSQRMADAYRHEGLAVDFLPVEHAGHEFAPSGSASISPSLDEIHRQTVGFFKRVLAPSR